MPSLGSDLPRALIIQLARLGDLLQSLPVISSLCEKFPDRVFDLLCPLPLVRLGRLFPGIQKTIPWNGEELHILAKAWDGGSVQAFPQTTEYFSQFPSTSYSEAYNLNNHSRSILAAHLFSERVIGSGDQGPLRSGRPPWVEYLREVAYERGANRIHLADAFCGLCGVTPPVRPPSVHATAIDLPAAIELLIKMSSLVRVGIVLGAGDVDRRVPLATWRDLIEACVESLPNSLCVLIGGAGEKEAALALEDQLPPHCMARVLNCVGRTTLPQLAHVFNRCQWVIGSDTGPLHLGVACGARVIGWYFSRARVHETGPYGVGHYVWQHQSNVRSENREVSRLNHRPELPCSWPVRETIALIQGHASSDRLSEWVLWTSQRDSWGVFYLNDEKPDDAVLQRKKVWERLSNMSSINYSECSSHTATVGYLS